MVRKRDETTNHDWLQRTIDRVNRESPVVDTNYSVEEVTPGYNTGGYYDVDVKETFVQVSPQRYDTLEDAIEWMNEHEADEGKYLAIRKHIAREMTTKHWFSIRLGDR